MTILRTKIRTKRRKSRKNTAFPKGKLFSRTFAIANKLQWRVKAAAQQNSNNLDSAFALHFTCTRKNNEFKNLKEQ